MTVRSIVTNEKKLALISEPVTSFDCSHSQAMLDLIDTACHHKQFSASGCAGLAMNQIGILLRVIAVYHGGEFRIMINPDFEQITKTVNHKLEGCLSRPGVNRRKTRFKKIRVEYRTSSGAHVSEVFTGFTARVIQHEIDHLDGKYI